MVQARFPVDVTSGEDRSQATDQFPQTGVTMRISRYRTKINRSDNSSVFISFKDDRHDAHILYIV